MQLLILFTVLFSFGHVSSQTWHPHGSHEYWFSFEGAEAPRIWHEARSFCNTQGGYLTSVLDEAEKNFIYDRTNVIAEDMDVWLGLNDLDNRDNSWVWVDNTPVTYTYWESEYPTTHDQFGWYCGYQKAKNTDGRWMNDHCDNSKAFVCKRLQGDTAPITDPPTPSVPGYCPEGYIGVPNSNKCFKVVIVPGVSSKTWNEAVNECRNGPGFLPDLASITNSDESALISTQIREQTYGVWIGLYKESDQDPYFKWVDNSPLTFQNWARGEPNGNFDLCAEVWATNTNDFGTWNDVSCDARKGWVCETYKDAGNPNDQSPSTAIPCPSGYTSFWYGCYKKHRERLTWDSAKARCETEGGFLVTIIAEAENAAMMLAVTDDDIPVWTGGRDFEGLGEYKWDDGWQFIYAKWGPNQPTIQGGCILFGIDGNWTAVSCGESNHFICKKTDAPKLTTPPIGEGTCPDGWEAYGSHCYYLELYDLQMWGQANTLCASKHRNSYLLSITGYEEQMYINQIITTHNIGSYDYWIGFYRSTDDEEWRWIDGATVNYDNWMTGEPNGDSGTQGCTEMLASSYVGKWNDHTCDQYQHYICKMPKETGATTTNVPGSTPAPGECPEGWEPEGTSCFLFLPDVQLQWQQAADRCQSEGGPDSYIASIADESENAYINTRMQELSTLPTRPHGYWIGYVKDSQFEDWYWMDRCILTFTNWAFGEPNDSDGLSKYTEVYFDNREWNDHTPDRAQGVVCRLRLEPCYDGNSMWKDDGTHQYYVSQSLDEIEYTWHNARAWCMQNGADLASFHSEAEQNVVTEWLAMDYIYDTRFWIGYNSLEAKNNVEFAWSDDSAKDYTAWAQNYPSDNNNGHYCVNQPSKNDDRWYNSHCDDLKGFVCKRQMGMSDPQTPAPTAKFAGYCPQGYFGLGETGNKCYKIVYSYEANAADGLSWDDAMAVCRSATGGLRPDLASIVDQYQMSLIMTQLQTASRFGFWTGAQRGSEVDPFKWVNNDAWNYTNWDAFYPDNISPHHCVELKTADVGRVGQWVNSNCGDRRGYICEIHKDGSYPEPPPSTVTCQQGFTPYWFECLRLKTDPLRTWIQANEECTSGSSFLPSIHTDAENEAIRLMVLRSGMNVWLGLKNYDGTGDYRWMDTWHVVYTNWGDGEPSDADGNGGCVSMHADGRWYDDNCDTLYAVPCKTTEALPQTTPAPLEGECPDPQADGIEWVEYGSHCYLFNTFDSTGWTRAQELCQARHQTANLVGVHDHLENNFVAEQLAKTTTIGTWIGYYRLKSGDSFSWIDGSINNFQRFAVGEPNNFEDNEDCVEIIPTGGFQGYWNDVGCSEPRPFACKMPKLPAVTTPPHTGGDCAAGWESYGANCYWFMPDDHTSWNSAQDKCQTVGNGSNLASIHSGGENDWIVKKMDENTHFPITYNFWIGFRLDADASDVDGVTSQSLIFKWVDGTGQAFTNWAFGEPNGMNGEEDCGEVSMENSDKGKWNDIACTHPFGYVCKYSKDGTNNAGESSSGGLSSGAVAGVVIGVILGVIVLGGVTVLLLSYLGVISGPIPARTPSPSAGLRSSGGGSSSKASPSGFGFTNNLYDNPDEVGTAAVSGDSVAYHADMDV